MRRRRRRRAPRPEEHRREDDRPGVEDTHCAEGPAGEDHGGGDQREVDGDDDRGGGARGEAPLDDVDGEIDERHDGDAEQHLGDHHVMVVYLHPEDAREERDREQHAYPQGVVKLAAQVHPVGPALLNAGRVFYPGPPESALDRPVRRPRAEPGRPKGGPRHVRPSPGRVRARARARRRARLRRAARRVRGRACRPARAARRRPPLWRLLTARPHARRGCSTPSWSTTRSPESCTTRGRPTPTSTVVVAVEPALDRWQGEEARGRRRRPRARRPARARRRRPGTRRHRGRGGMRRQAAGGARRVRRGRRGRRRRARAGVGAAAVLEETVKLPVLGWVPPQLSEQFVRQYGALRARCAR